MNSIPQELVFLLIAGVVLLVQFVLKLQRRRSAPEQTQPDELDEPEGSPRREMQQPALATPAAPVVTPVLRTRPRPVAVLAQREPHRFSRRALMGDRRAVQDAIVIATILGPCRAYRPHDID
jgi:hypothetical protein